MAGMLGVSRRVAATTRIGEGYPIFHISRQGKGSRRRLHDVVFDKTQSAVASEQEQNFNVFNGHKWNIRT